MHGRIGFDDVDPADAAQIEAAEHDADGQLAQYGGLSESHREMSTKLRGSQDDRQSEDDRAAGSSCAVDEWLACAAMTIGRNATRSSEPESERDDRQKRAPWSVDRVDGGPTIQRPCSDRRCTLGVPMNRQHTLRQPAAVRRSSLGPEPLKGRTATIAVRSPRPDPRAGASSCARNTLHRARSQRRSGGVRPDRARGSSSPACADGREIEPLDDPRQAAAMCDEQPAAITRPLRHDLAGRKSRERLRSTSVDAIDHRRAVFIGTDDARPVGRDRSTHHRNTVAVTPSGVNGRGSPPLMS